MHLQPVARRALLAAHASQGRALRRTKGGFTAVPAQIQSSGPLQVEGFTRRAINWLANAGPGRGLPIGNLSSQFFANVYLDALDQFVKHQLKARRYLRYVDDFVLFHHDRAQLARWQVQIEQFLAARLQLRLKPEIRLRRLEDGLDFLGYIIRPTHTRARARVVGHVRQALAEWEGQYVQGDRIRCTPAQLEHLQCRVASYGGHLCHARSHRLRAALHHRFPWLATALVRRRFPARDLGRAITLRIHR